MKRQLLLSLAATLLTLPTIARNFQYTYEGKTITYTVINEADKTCKTKDGNLNNPGNNVSGDLILPSEVYDGDIQYTLIEIGSNAFYYCSGLTSVAIPNSVTEIGHGAFNRCRGLTLVDIGESVSSLGNDVFIECTSLKAINVAIGNNHYTSVEGIVYSKDMSQLVQYPAGKEEKEFIIPNIVTKIGQQAFSNCTGLTSVTIPNSVITINNEAFYECSGLTSITIPSSVATIGDYTFEGCRGLTSVTIPSSVTIIGNEAFLGCGGLTSITIPSSVTKIGDYAFQYCSGLTSVIYLAKEPIVGSGRIFDEETYQKATLNYLKSAEEKIASTEPWSRFVNRIGRDADYSAIAEVHATDGGATAVYDIRGVKVGTSTCGLTKGIYIIREGSTTRKTFIN